jgi:arylformamidase
MLIDLSHTIRPGAGNRKFVLETVGADQVNPNVLRRENEWYVMHNISMVNHLGTHIESPYHLYRDGADLSAIPLETLCGEAILLDLSGRPPRSEIGLDDVVRAAAESGGVKKGDIVFCDLGLAGLYGTPAYGENPYFATAALDWLAGEGMKLMGVDAGGVEVPGSPEHVNHRALLGRGIPLIENLANLEALTSRRFRVWAFPIAVAGVDSFPVRVVADCS